MAPGRKRKVWEVKRVQTQIANMVLEKQIKSKDKVIGKLREEVKYFNEQKEQLIKTEEKLAKLYTLGLIDSAGEVIQVTPPGSDSDEMK